MSSWALLRDEPLSLSNTKQTRTAATTSTTTANSSGNKRMRVETSSSSIVACSEVESKITVLQLQSELRSQRESHAAAMSKMERDRSALNRHLRFVEGEANAARGELERNAERLLEEKQHLASKLVEVRAELESARHFGETQGRVVDDLQRQMPAQMSLAEVRGGYVAQLDAMQGELRNQTEAASTAKAELAAVSHELEKVRRKGASAAWGQTAAAGIEEGGLGATEARKLRQKLATTERACSRKAHEVLSLERDRGNHQLLEEKLREVQAQVRRLEEELSRASHVAAQNEMLQQEKRQWVETLAPLFGSGSGSGSVTPVRVLDLIREGQQARTVLLKRHGELEARNARLNASLIDKQRLLAEQSRLRVSAEEKACQAEAGVGAANRQCDFFRSECESLQELLRSFDAESKMGHGAAEEAVAQRDMRIKALEESLARAQTQLSGLVAEQQGMTPNTVVSKSRDRVRELEDAAAASAKETEKLSRQLDKALADIAVLESRTAKGDFNPATTKVLHITNNPTKLAKAAHQESEELNRLREENRQLKQRLEGDAGGGGLPPPSSSSPSSLEQDDATAASGSGSGSGGGGGGGDNSANSLMMMDTSIAGQKDADASVLNQRLKQVFRERISWFREAVYLLTGYKIDMAHDRDRPQLRLRSMYGESPEDDLLFQWTQEQDALELIETPFARTLDKKIFTYLTTCKSVPAFLSNLTLDLFEKQTFMG